MYPRGIMCPLRIHVTKALVVLLNILCAAGTNWDGPVIEDPANRIVAFANDTGHVISCHVTGQPPPMVQWQDLYGNLLEDVPGLRTRLANGSLLYAPFASYQFRADIHATSVQCRASNLHGTVIGAQMEIRAVVEQTYSVSVSEVTVDEGSLAVLQCRISNQATSYVQVTGWRFGPLHLTAGHRADRLVAWRHLLMVRRTKSSYDQHQAVRCETLNSITNEARLSNEAFIHFSAEAEMSAGVIYADLPSVIRVDQGEELILYCPVQGTSNTPLRWYRGTDRSQLLLETSRLTVGTDFISVTGAVETDSDRYRCELTDPRPSAGSLSTQDDVEKTTHTFMVQVIPKVQVTIKPGHQMLLEEGHSGSLKCEVYPASLQSSLVWLRNGEVINTARGRSIISLPVNDPHVPGMYQCHVTKQQATVQVKLAERPPRLVSSVVDQAVMPDSTAKFNCAASGHPQPKITWQHAIGSRKILTGMPNARHKVTVTSHGAGDVTSQLVISHVTIDDAGEYRCVADNPAGSVQHSARLNVFSAVAALPRRTVTVAARSRTVLDCPVSGYPLSDFAWRIGSSSYSSSSSASHSSSLSLSGHSVLANGSLASDGRRPLVSGQYECEARGGDGTLITAYVDLVVMEPPEISPFAFPHSLHVGQRTQAACSITSGALPIHISWLKNNRSLATVPSSQRRDRELHAVTGEFFSNLVFKNLQEHHAGIYTCRASNSVAVRQYSARLSVLVPPRWLSRLDDVISAVIGDDVTLNCSVYGRPMPSVRWIRSSDVSSTSEIDVPFTYERVPLLAADSAVLQLRQIDVSMADEYTCRASNGVGSDISQTIRLVVHEPARFGVHRRNVSVAVFSSVSFSCRAAGEQPIQLSWLRDSRPLPSWSSTERRVDNDDDLVLTLSNVTRRHAGHYTCVARNKFGSDRSTWVLAVTEKPEAPGNVRVTEVRSRSALVTWSAPFDGNEPITRYLVRVLKVKGRKALMCRQNKRPVSLEDDTTHLDAKAWQAAVNVSVSSHQRSTLVTRLTPGYTHWLSVTAVNKLGAGAVSRAVCVITPPPRPSTPPLNVRLQPLTSRKLHVQWTMPIVTGLADITGYIVQYRELASRPPIIRTVHGGRRSVTLVDLQPHTVYTVHVRSFNSAGQGPPSIAVTGSTLQDVPVSSVKRLRCNATGSGSLRVSWQRPADDEIRGSLIGYRLVYRKRLLQYGDKVIVKEIQADHVILSDLDACTTYLVLVAAQTVMGTGPFSAAITCKTQLQVPSAPQRLKLATLSVTSVRLAWLAPKTCASEVFKYRVYRSKNGRRQHRAYEVKSNDPLTVTVRSLTRGQFYTWWVAAVSSIGESSPSNTVANKPPRKGDVRILSFSGEMAVRAGSTVLLDCVTSSDRSSRNTIIWSLLNNQPNKSSISVSSSSPPSSSYSSSFVSSLPDVSVLANNSLSIGHVTRLHTGNWSCRAVSGDFITVRLFIKSLPIVTSPEVVMATQSSLHIKWSLMDDGNLPVQKFYVRYKPAESKEWTEMASYQLAHDLIIRDLLCGTRYKVTVSAENYLGRGEESLPLLLSTDGSKPIEPKPVDMMTSNSTCIIIWLYDWSSSCDVTHFTIHVRSLVDRGAAMRRLTQLFPASVDLAEVCGLPSGTWFRVRCTAHSAAGNTTVEHMTATLTALGERLTTAPLADKSESWSLSVRYQLFVVMPVCACVVCILTAAMCFYKNRRRLQCESRCVSSKQLNIMIPSDSHSQGHISESKLLSEQSYNLRECQRWYGSDDLRPYATVDLRRKNLSPRKIREDSCVDQCHYASVDAIATSTGTNFTDVTTDRTLQSGVSLQPYRHDLDLQDVDLDLVVPAASSVPPPPRRCDRPRHPTLSTASGEYAHNWRYTGRGETVLPPQDFLY